MIKRQLQPRTVQVDRERRVLHLIDVENLCASGLPTERHVRATLERYRNQMGVGTDDQVVLAASGHTAFLAGAAWPGARVVVGYGPDGADRALLAYVDVRHISRRFGTVVLGSGDHIFAALITNLIQDGIAVTVVAVTGAIAQDLRIARPQIRHFEALPSSNERRPAPRCSRRIDSTMATWSSNRSTDLRTDDSVNWPGGTEPDTPRRQIQQSTRRVATIRRQIDRRSPLGAELQPHLTMAASVGNCEAGR